MECFAKIVNVFQIKNTYFEEHLGAATFGMSLNPLVHGIHWKVTHTSTNLQLEPAVLFKYVWPFSGHQALKGLNLLFC